MGEALPTTETVRAAGAVLWRPGLQGPEIAIIHRPKYDDWSFPKGKLKHGEHVLRAALREIEEETGVAARLGRRLSDSVYEKDGRPKRVDYWSALAEGGEFEPNDEVDRLDWLSLEEAEHRLSYERDVELLREFAAGPIETRPIVILRHASAGEKRFWHEDDVLRPLDARGRAEAVELAELLAGYFGGVRGFGGPVRLISSATSRCVETVLPYALRVHTSVTTDLAFTVGETDSAQARDRLVEIVDDGVPTIVCTHGEIVADLVTGLLDRFGAEAPLEPALRKAGFWVAHLGLDTGQISGVTALERHAVRC